MTTRKAILRDPVLQDGRDTDVVIPIMGQTKAGKSSLVNQLLGWDQMRVGEGLDSCTKYIQATVVDSPPDRHGALKQALDGRRIVFLDTPGFDDTELGDDEVLFRIVYWLEATYRRGMLVGGVLYLHDITRDGWSGTSRKNLHLFSKLCGENSLSQVSFVTTKWDDVTAAKWDKAHKRTCELRSNQWKDMVAGGASVYHLRPSQNPAIPPSQDLASPLQDLRDPWDIVHEIVASMNARDVGRRILLIQDELVNQQLFVIESQAGQEIRATLQDLLERAKDLQSRKAAVNEDREALEELQNEIDNLTKRLAQLNPKLHHRLKRWMRKAFNLS